MAVSAVSAVDTGDLSDSLISVENPEGSGDVTSEMPELNISVADTPYNEKAKVEINLKTNASMPKVNIFVDGNAVKNLTIFMGGKGTYNVPAKTYDVGSHTVEVKYTDSTYGVISKSAVFNITQVTPIVSVNNVTAYVGEIVTVPFTVTDNKGKGMAGKARVTIYLHDGNNVSQIVEFNDSSKYDFDFDLSKLFNGTNLNISGLFNGSNFNISGKFNGTGFNISGLFNGTNFNITGLFNGTSMFNGTGFNLTGLNITGLLNGTGFNMSALFNGTGVDISGLLNGTGFNLTGLLDGTGLNLTGLLNGTDFKSFFNGTDFSSKFNITNFDIESIFGGDTVVNTDSDSSGKLMAYDAVIKTANFDISNITNNNGTKINISGLLAGLGIDLSKIFGGGAKEHNATFDYPFDAGVYKMTVELLGDVNYASVTNDTAKLTIIGNSTDNGTVNPEVVKAANAPVTGNPIFLMFLALFAIFGLGFRKQN